VKDWAEYLIRTCDITSTPPLLGSLGSGEVVVSYTAYGPITRTRAYQEFLPSIVLHFHTRDEYT
jgi:hypothetical protein